MQRVELRIGTASAREIAMTAFLPDPRRCSGVAIFASPGGGYGRGYFDMRFTGHAGYSEAEHHVANGHLFVAYDHAGVGDSSLDGLSSMTIEDIAEHNHLAVAECLRRIRAGRLAEGFPAIPRVAAIGIGQSMGGGVTIIMQARHRSFDAIGVLGYSAIHSVLPQRSEEAVEQGKRAYAFSRETVAETLSLERTSAQVADFFYPFHWEDVPGDIVEIDISGGYPIRRTAPPFGSLTIPNCVVAMLAPGYVRDEAAAIDVPVLAAFGERDTSPDPRAEPGAYARARDVSLLVVPRMAHMHNFASTRQRLWARTSGWAQMIAQELRTREY